MSEDSKDRKTQTVTIKDVDARYARYFQSLVRYNMNELGITKPEAFIHLTKILAHVFNSKSSLKFFEKTYGNIDLSLPDDYPYKPSNRPF